MAVLLIDQNKKRAQAIRLNLQGTPIGLSIESFLEVNEAVRWARMNPCDIILFDQTHAENTLDLASLQGLNHDIPVLILKNSQGDFDVDLGVRTYDYLEMDFNRAGLLLRLENILSLQLAKCQARKANDDYFAENKQRFELAVSASNDGVWDWDISNDQIFYSSRWCEIIGYRELDLDKTTACWFARVHPDDVTLLDTAIHSHLVGVTERFSFEYRIRHKNGHYRWVLTRGQVIVDENNQPVRMIGSQTDITDRKQSEQLVAFNALHDSLTGLANRALLMERLQQVVLHHRRDPSHHYSVLFMDLDNFKGINDNLGHEAGDLVLKTVAQRLNLCVREIDTLSRFGGDEFVILVAGTSEESAVIGLAERILKEMEKPILIGSQNVNVGISVGIVTKISDYDDASSSVRDADLALYHAKSKGRNRYEMYNPSMSMGTSAHFALQATLFGAKDRKELILHYQPILSLKTGEVLGFEALMRWQHPENGVIYPLDFIPVAEETGLINEIGAWGVYEACKQLKVWKDILPGTKDWFMCVNVSAKQLESDHFDANVRQALIDTGVEGKHLTIEMTETMLMHNIEHMEPKLRQLKNIGVKLAIDDFGTGYSSLAVLNDFPFDILKVAREFISAIDSRHKSSRTVKLIHLLAKETKMKTIIEGIETSGELECVQDIGCDMAQGFLFSKPRDAKTLTQMLQVDPKRTFLADHIFTVKTA